MQIRWSYNLGVWVWGTVLSFWLLFVGIALALPGSAWSASLSCHDSLAAALTAVLGVIWSYFIKLDAEASAANSK
jgi:hypothetical protein